MLCIQAEPSDPAAAEAPAEPPTTSAKPAVSSGAKTGKKGNATESTQAQQAAPEPSSRQLATDSHVAAPDERVNGAGTTQETTKSAPAAKVGVFVLAQQQIMPACNVLHLLAA